MFFEIIVIIFLVLNVVVIVIELTPDMINVTRSMFACLLIFGGLVSHYTEGDPLEISDLRDNTLYTVLSQTEIDGRYYSYVKELDSSISAIDTVSKLPNNFFVDTYSLDDDFKTSIIPFTKELKDSNQLSGSESTTSTTSVTIFLGVVSEEIKSPRYH